MVKKIRSHRIHASAVMSDDGFAIVLTLLLILILVLFACTVLLLASSYYSSGRNMFEIQNCRLNCESALKRALDRHNAGDEEPRFFFDPANWQGRKLLPYSWNGYEISGYLSEEWKSSASNIFTFSTRKGPFVSEQQVELRQLRLEDFALYGDALQVLNTASFFDGRLRNSEGLELNTGGVIFRDFVHSVVTPEEYADSRKFTLQQFDYPDLGSILPASRFRQDAVANGILISSCAVSPFWNKDHCEVDMDRLDIEPSGKKWRVTYAGLEIGRITTINLWFDGPLTVKQAFVPQRLIEQSPLSGKALYVCSSSVIRIDSSLQHVVRHGRSFPICLVAGEHMRVTDATPRAVRFQACLISLGSINVDDAPYGVVVERDGSIIAEPEKQALRYEILTSPLLFEEASKQAFLQSLETGSRCVWFRGSVLTRWPLLTSGAPVVHFEASRQLYDLLPSFPFIQIVEGSRLWR